MITQSRIRTVCTLAAVAMAILVLPAAADIPNPLPDPDTTPPDSTKPVKVYILSGQSNMVGMGNISPLGTPGTLETITKTDGMFPNLLDDAGAWTVRNDVMYRGVITALGNAPLTVGQGSASTAIGPELGFGHVMGYYFNEPVLGLKTSQGNRSLLWDCLPPGSPRFDYNGNTYAGYGDSPNSWPIGGGPSPYGWYAGKQYDDFFLAESDMGAPAWADATAYPVNCQVRQGGGTYISKTAHTSSADSKPGIGAQWATYWNVYSVFNVTDILDNWATQYPQWAAQGFEIAGFVWWQGNKDLGEPGASRYETNLVPFIKQLRHYYENRYPGHIKTNAPFVLATGCGDPGTSGYGLVVAEAQLAVSGERGKYPEFAGNVKTMDTRGYWRSVAESPADQGYHYNRNAETFMLTGDALGRGMVELLTPYSVDAGDDMITWSGRAVQLDATVQDGVTVVSYAWKADPNDGVVFDSNSIEYPTVTITKATDNPSTVTLRLTVDDGENPPVTDAVRINVYDDACLAAKAAGLGADNPGDFDGNCITGFEDLAEAAAKWLTGNALTAPVAK